MVPLIPWVPRVVQAQQRRRWRGPDFGGISLVRCAPAEKRGFLPWGVGVSTAADPYRGWIDYCAGITGSEDCRAEGDDDGGSSDTYTGKGELFM